MNLTEEIQKHKAIIMEGETTDSLNAKLSEFEREIKKTERDFINPKTAFNKFKKKNKKVEEATEVKPIKCGLCGDTITKDPYTANGKKLCSQTCYNFEKKGLPKNKKVEESFDSVRDEKDAHFYDEGNDDKALQRQMKEDNSDLKELTKEYSDKGVKISLSVRPDRIVVNSLNVPKEKRNQGIGTSFMEALCKIADEDGKVMFLTPSKDFGATSVDRLVKFYSRFGFKSNKGKTIDFTSRDTMKREPKTIVKEEFEILDSKKSYDQGWNDGIVAVWKQYRRVTDNLPKRDELRKIIEHLLYN